MGVVVLSVFSNIHGQGLALHGPPGSLKRAVRGMYHCQQVIVLLFSLSMFFFMAQVVVYSVMLNLNGTDRHMGVKSAMLIGISSVGILGITWGVGKITSLFAIDGEKTETVITSDTAHAMDQHFVAAQEKEEPLLADADAAPALGAEGDLKPAHSVTFSEDYASEYGARDSGGLARPRRRKGFGSVVASIFGGYDRESHTANKIERERDAIVARYSEHRAAPGPF